ncbi:PP2C family protein-serine/threonine phosphatase [Desulforegula conservatrix]|uniref:PP2C family protein-serine/threonine phosphatase n=1 Tax=Desulforegula conservatrix TaxID=153026 RepID=UPI000408170F|nr:SpoIIE family protein phosphatase [Desulforegula conservatrix]
MIFAKKTYKRIRSISFRLLAYILLVSSFLTLIITVLQLYFDYKKDISIIEESLKQIKISYTDSIAHHVWNMDTDGLKTQLNGILSMRDIVYAEINMAGEKSALSVSAGEKATNIPLLIAEYPVIYERSGTYISIASLKVAASKVEVIQRLKEKFFIILASQTVKTFIVSIFIVILSNMIITKHLAVMGNYAANLDLGKLDDPLVLNRKHGKNSRLDELDLVVRAINRMRQRLKISYEEIKAKSRIEGELGAAASLQRYVIPRKAPESPSYDVSFLFLPALEVSGDYFDFFEIDDSNTGIVIADASGKGMPASIHINTVRVLLRSRPELHRFPDIMLNIINTYVRNELPENQFITMAYLLMKENGNITYLCAGHEPLIHCNSQGEITFIKPSGYPICCIHADNFETRLQSHMIDLQPNETLVLYTDGATDAMDDNGKMLGEGFYDMIKNLIHLTAKEMMDEIKSQIMHYQGSKNQNDDITIIVIKRK